MWGSYIGSEVGNEKNKMKKRSNDLETGKEFQKN